MRISKLNNRDLQTWVHQFCMQPSVVLYRHQWIEVDLQYFDSPMHGGVATKAHVNRDEIPFKVYPKAPPQRHDRVAFVVPNPRDRAEYIEMLRKMTIEEIADYQIKVETRRDAQIAARDAQAKAYRERWSQLCRILVGMGLDPIQPDARELFAGVCRQLQFLIDFKVPAAMNERDQNWIYGWRKNTYSLLRKATLLRKVFNPVSPIPDLINPVGPLAVGLPQPEQPHPEDDSDEPLPPPVRRPAK
jgi:hypothetical protein